MTKYELLEYCEDNQESWMKNAFNFGMNMQESFEYIVNKIEAGEITTMEEIKKYRIVD